MKVQFEILPSQVEAYVSLVKAYFEANKKTSTVQVDTLILLFRITWNQHVFELLLTLHKFLLDKILNVAYNKYRGSLYKEDYLELSQMLRGEFFRRVLYYKFPPVAPFSSYVKGYLAKWLNTYVKIMAKKNSRTILFVDYYGVDINEEE
jgi:hypothetical protein